MIEKLTVVTLVVKDQAKALDFYTRVLGLEKRTDFAGPSGVRWLTVAPKGQDIEIGLFPAGAYPDPRGVEMQLQPGKGARWTFQTTDCRKDFEELKSRGVMFDQSKPDEYAWGIQATFNDPDGNSFVILQQSPKQAW